MRRSGVSRGVLGEGAGGVVDEGREAGEVGAQELGQRGFVGVIEGGGLVEPACGLEEAAAVGGGVGDDQVDEAALLGGGGGGGGVDGGEVGAEALEPVGVGLDELEVVGREALVQHVAEVAEDAEGRAVQAVADAELVGADLGEHQRGAQDGVAQAGAGVARGVAVVGHDDVGHHLELGAEELPGRRDGGDEAALEEGGEADRVVARGARGERGGGVHGENRARRSGGSMGQASDFLPKKR
jgi:hypothetical protein